MSSHPYRQKAPSHLQSAPYPIEMEPQEEHVNPNQSGNGFGYEEESASSSNYGLTVNEKAFYQGSNGHGQYPDQKFNAPQEYQQVAPQQTFDAPHEHQQGDIRAAHEYQQGAPQEYARGQYENQRYTPEVPYIQDQHTPQNGQNQEYHTPDSHPGYNAQVDYLTPQAPQSNYHSPQAAAYAPQTVQEYHTPQAEQQAQSNGTQGEYETPQAIIVQAPQPLSGYPDQYQDSNIKSPIHGPAKTPPPVFPKQSQIISPPSNPLSATSSVTNLNLNHQFGHLGLGQDSTFSKSENNLNTPPQFHKYGHNRSVSSTSSFIHDRSDSASLIDFSQNLIQQYLGNNSSTLVPRMKTIELYRKNAKRSNDPGVLFEYAQYMLQTALLLDTDGSNGSTPKTHSQVNSPARKINSHSKSKSFDDKGIPGSGANGEPINDKVLKRALLKEATIYLRKLSDKGYVDAQYLLADAYASGALFKVENREAFALFQSAAKHGHIESAYRTSYCYEEGLGTGRDSRKAIEYLKISASKNHPAAMYRLGLYSFYSRMGLPRDLNTKKSGIKWLERASNVANELIAGAPFELGKIYFHGFEDIIIPDKKYALELYSQSAALNHIGAAALLGQFYEVGEIVPQDSNLSIHYYTQAALGGDPESMLAMCAWYLVGSDPFLPKDESEAFEWAKRAALCNLPKAQFALANFYEKGIGCIKNVNEAQSWYRRAAEGGDDKSKARITDKAFVAKLTKQQLKKRKSDLNLTQATSYSPMASGNGPVSSTLDAKAQDKDCIVM